MKGRHGRRPAWKVSAHLDHPAGEGWRRFNAEAAYPQSIFRSALGDARGLDHHGGPEGGRGVEGQVSHSGSRLFLMASQRFFRRAWAVVQPRTIRWYATASSSKIAASHSAQSS
jgi:hypothetical protein